MSVTAGAAAGGQEPAAVAAATALAAQLAERADRDDEAGEFPRDAFDALARQGLTRLPFATSDGGAGEPFAVYLRVLEELARAHVVVALTLSVHTMVAGIVAGHAQPPARQRALEPLLAGQALGAYCLSEPHSGSDAAALSTAAYPDGDGWRLRGTKAWVTHGGHADWYVVMARSHDADGHATPGPAGITAFLVAGDADGLHPALAERKMGMRASPTAAVHLDDVVVPDAFRLGGVGEGFRVALAGLDGGRLGVAAAAVGLARCAVDHTAAALRAARSGREPRAGEEAAAFALADMATDVAAARALTYAAEAHREAAGARARPLASMAKLVATDTAMRVTSAAVGLLGPAAGASGGAERLFREAKVMQIFEGTNQIQRQIIARGVLGDGGRGGAG